MTICLPKLKGGKGSFYKRLYSRLKSMGIKVVRDINGKYDILLMSRDFWLLNTLSRKKKIVLRLDGLAISPNDKYIRLMKKRVDGVVYQSQFTKQVFDKYIHRFTQISDTILNGADPEFYRSIKPLEKIALHQLISFASWKPSQRLEDIVESYLLADIPESCLLVVGNLRFSGVSDRQLSRYRNTGRVHFLGQLEHTKMAGYMKSSDAAIHIRWCDWCPNGVVEAVCCGLTVITNNVSGTKEIVEKSGGIICNIDQPLDCLPKKTMKPPSIDRRILAEAVLDTTKNKRNITCDHVNIKNVARQYLSLFKKVAKSR